MEAEDAMPKRRVTRRIVEIDGKPVELPEREYEIYTLLEERREKGSEPIAPEVLEREITGEVYEERPGHYTRNYIQRLRDRLEDAGVGRARIIRNTYGRGYWLWSPKDPEPQFTPRKRTKKARPSIDRQPDE
jgi:DNA-binding response OmpR family regulator